MTLGHGSLTTEESLTFWGCNELDHAKYVPKSGQK
jgi:hypothetical protein